MYNRLIRMLFKNTNKTVLGRWERTGRVQNKIKIDLANTDHCGTCHYVPYVPKPKDLEFHELVGKKDKPTKLLGP
jgi:hypothetical protein